jgi:hypothetical protein
MLLNPKINKLPTYIFWNTDEVMHFSEFVVNLD